jgi:hypothetical protein
MIELHCYKGRHVPFIRCDNCGQRIRDAENAVVAWHAIHRMRFVHKGACALELAEHSSDEWDGSMELDRFLVDLFNNAGFDWQHAQEHAFPTGIVAGIAPLEAFQSILGDGSHTQK